MAGERHVPGKEEENKTKQQHGKGKWPKRHKQLDKRQTDQTEEDRHEKTLRTQHGPRQC